MYVGDAFGKKWNTAWSARWRMMAGSIFEFSIDQLPQQPFENLLSIVFYSVIDDEYGGKIPDHIKNACTIPVRTYKRLQQILQENREGITEGTGLSRRVPENSTMKSESEIHEQIDKATETEEQSRYPGMNYEQGVRAALEWALGHTDELPMEDE